MSMQRTASGAMLESPGLFVFTSLLDCYADVTLCVTRTSYQACAASNSSGYFFSIDFEDTCLPMRAERPYVTHRNI